MGQVTKLLLFSLCLVSFIIMIMKIHDNFIAEMAIKEDMKEAIVKCRKELISNKLEFWALGIGGKKVFSQNDEDGAIEAVFEHLGTTDKIYVEFGVEDCTECNTRYLR